MADLPVADDLIAPSITEGQFKAALKILVENVVSKDYVNNNALFKPVAISSGQYTHIDQFKTAGYYFVRSTAIATAIVGLPESRPCIIEVIANTNSANTNIVSQIIRPLGAAYYYFRSTLSTGEFAATFEKVIGQAAIATLISTASDAAKAAATAEAKTYSDTKLDAKQVIYAYSDGNMIGAKTLRYPNFGLRGDYTIADSTVYDAVIVPVQAGDTLYIHNDQSRYTGSTGSNYAFFAQNPFLNRAQTALATSGADSSTTDSTSAIIYKKAIAPADARYLIVNERFTANAGGTTNYNWAVHKDAFNPAYTQGNAYVAEIDGIKFKDTSVKLSKENNPTVSAKNIYTGDVNVKARVNDNGVYISANANDILSPFIPVEFGKTYTISGIPRDMMATTATRIMGVASNTVPSTDFVKVLTTTTDTTVTVTINDVQIKYIVFPLAANNLGVLEKAQFAPVQIEVGSVATAYQPSEYTIALQRVINKFSTSANSSGALKDAGIKVVSQFIDLNMVREPQMSTVSPIIKGVGPRGASYGVKGTAATDSASNNIYAQFDVLSDSNKAVNVNVIKYVNGERAAGVLHPRAFSVPSGALDNPDSFAYADKYPKDLSTHPVIAYTATPIAGFNYWMISSTFPPTSESGVKWEDEDMFVSNDAVTWQRIRSVYETDKSYTTATLRLPPQTLVTNNSRKHCFLPSPAVGDVFEVSVPASNGAPALDRQTMTLSTRLPWKHDPYLLIDDGYIYTYHSFNLFFNERNDEKSHFFVCVRTNNGIDWDVVRTDGSTMRLTEATSRQLFTKDDQGRYNYMNYAYNDDRQNPEIVKYGTGDYELVWGRNFTVRYKGTTPYAFDFSTAYPFKDTSSTNHPTLLFKDNILYVITNKAVYQSTDRGATLTVLPKYPMWLGGVQGFGYKKSCCIGAGDKFIVADTQRINAPAFTSGAVNAVNDINQVFFYEYPSFTDFLTKANTGLIDAYIDLQVTKVNLNTNSRQVLNIPCISPTASSATGIAALYRLKVADLELKAGDTVYFHVTLNSRSGAEIVFGGIDLT
ncbi:pyocin knob domain-containing protein [Alkanindiges illinoisensis]|uniref:pyocin knob domain-containing protein n=1 Tax=Alkanindiges illinoisensis TaxID=197183 RepID=UPI00047BF207|nr:pyocin knob domain-containing protein [Alkanindiges illinoisensis]